MCNTPHTGVKSDFMPRYAQAVMRSEGVRLTDVALVVLGDFAAMTQIRPRASTVTAWFRPSLGRPGRQARFIATDVFRVNESGFSLVHGKEGRLQGLTYPF